MRMKFKSMIKYLNVDEELLLFYRDPDDLDDYGDIVYNHVRVDVKHIKHQLKVHNISKILDYLIEDIKSGVVDSDKHSIIIIKLTLV